MIRNASLLAIIIIFFAAPPHALAGEKGSVAWE